MNLPNFVLADAENLPFKDMSFTKVVASHLIEHLNDPLKFKRECLRVATALELFYPHFLSYSAYQDETHKWVILNKEITPITRGMRFFSKPLKIRRLRMLLGIVLKTNTEQVHCVFRRAQVSAHLGTPSQAGAPIDSLHIPETQIPK